LQLFAHAQHDPVRPADGSARCAGTSRQLSGVWKLGESTSSDKGAIDCSGKRVITFNGNLRTDSQGGMPDFRNESITTAGPTRYRVVDEFTTA